MPENLQLIDCVIGRPQIKREEGGVQITGLRKRILVDYGEFFNSPVILNDESIEQVCRSLTHFGPGRTSFLGHKAELLHPSKDLRERQIRFIHYALHPGGYYVVEGDTAPYEETVSKIFGEPIHSFPYYNELDKTQGKVNIYQKQA